MKKILTILPVIALMTSMHSCKKLDLAPEDYYTASNFWKTPAQVDGR